MSWEPRKLSVEHCEMLRLYSLGTPMVDIAVLTGRSYGMVQNIVASDLGQEYLKRIIDNRLDLTDQLLTDARAAAPAILHEKIRLSLHATDERVRGSNGNDVLNLAGLQPVTRVQVEHVETIREKYADKTEAEILDEVRQEVFGGEKAPVDSETVH